MGQRPFLASFAVKRNQDNSSEFSSYYDENLEMNVVTKRSDGIVPSENSIEYLSTMTKTSVKSEKPDVDADSAQSFRDEPDQQIFMATQTLTEVAKERPDRDAPDDHLVFLATHTSTRISPEKPDNDV